MARRWIGWTLACAVVAGIVGLAPRAHAQTRLNYSIFFPASHRNSVLAAEWSREIESRSAGKVRINLFYGGTLTPADKCYDGVVKGISDIGMSVLSYTMGRFPLTEVLDLPLGARTGAAATRLANDFYARFKPRELDDVKVLYLHAHGPGLLHTMPSATPRLIAS